MKVPRLFPLFACAFALASPTLSGADYPLDLQATPRIYKTEETKASFDALPGEGVKLNYEFADNRGSLYYRYEFPNISGVVRKITVKAKGTDNTVFLGLRDSGAVAHNFTLGPLTEEEQTFEIEIAPIADKDGKTKEIQYPIKFIDFLFKMKGGQNAGFLELYKVNIETSE